MDYIKLKDCIEGGLYIIEPKIYTVGIFWKEIDAFIVIENKWDSRFLNLQYHFENGIISGPFVGIIKPTFFVCMTPKHLLLDTDPETTQELFTWLDTQLNSLVKTEDGNYYCIGRVISKTDQSDLNGDLIVRHIQGNILVRHSSPLAPELLIAKLNSDR